MGEKEKREKGGEGKKKAKSDVNSNKSKKKIGASVAHSGAGIT